MIRRKLLACCPTRDIAAQKNVLRAAVAAADVGVELIVPLMGETKA